jgi:hypothetical protein
MSTQQPQRAKGRAQTSREFGIPSGRVLGWYLPSDEYAEAVERMARAMMRVTYGTSYTGQAIAALKSIGIAAPRKERKQP